MRRFCSALDWYKEPLQKVLPDRKNGIHASALPTWGISRSLVDSCLCMWVTFPTRKYLANRSQPSPGVHCGKMSGVSPIKSDGFLRISIIVTLLPYGFLTRDSPVKDNQII